MIFSHDLQQTFLFYCFSCHFTFDIFDDDVANQKINLGQTAGALAAGVMASVIFI
jgi:hypothetical protein